ncbi:nitroreductase/quinone reductase family protein [Pseudonocardia sp. GCM10023141]|uniref:nitroreductase/quinone reductase family protein n=1 Tax=Pseudonocardia sp. GCM10023141 TaxID=3252653 RepID=UPI0036090B40
MMHRVARRLAASQLVVRVFGPLIHRIDRSVPMTQWLSGMPVVQLTTTGARTGQRRTVSIVGIGTPDGVEVAGGNGGALRHPAWCLNLRADPHALLRIGRRESPVVARELTGAERDRAWARSLAVHPDGAAYVTRAGGRLIPIFRLEPVGGNAG